MHTDSHSLTDKSDAELVAAARSGRGDAFDELTRRHYTMVYAVALSRLKDRDRAEDLAQEVFLHAWLLLEHLADTRLFSHWLSRIARNLAIDWQRRGAAGARLLPMIAMDHTVTQVPDAKTDNPRDAAAAREKTAALQRVLELMEPKQREVVLLHYMSGMTHREIGRHMGINQSTVSRLLDRTLSRMRDQAEAVLREMARNLGPRPQAHASATALGLLILGLSVTQKAALAATAAKTLRISATTSRAKLIGIPVSAGSRVSFLSAAKTGGTIVASSKTIVAAGTAAIVAAALYYHSHRQPSVQRADLYTTAAADTQPALLKWAPPVGRRVVVHVEQKSDTKMEFPPALQQMKDMQDMGGTEVQDLAFTARDVSGDGSRTIEIETLASSFSMNSPALAKILASAAKTNTTPASASADYGSTGSTPYMQQFIGRKLAAHVNSAGQVQSIDGLKEANDSVRQQVNKAASLMGSLSPDSLWLEHFKQLVSPAALPGSQIKVGDTWKSENKLQIPMLGEATISSTNRFVGWRILDGRKVAEVQIDSSQNAPVESAMKMMKMKYERHSSSGTFYFDPEMGQVTQCVANTYVEMIIEIPKIPVKLPNGAEMKITSHRSMSQKIVQDSGNSQLAMK